MKRVGLSLLLLLGTLQLAGCSTISGWFGGSEPAVKPAELVEIKPSIGFAKAWEAGVGAGQPYSFSPATDGEGVYVAAKDGRIVRLDLATGREVWRAESGKTLSAGVGVGVGLVLVGTPKGEVLAFRAADGQAAWTARLSGEILTPPVADGGMVAARSNDGTVHLLSAEDGKRRWIYSRTLPALILRAPGNLLITDKAVFAGHPGGKVTALSLTNGAPLWESNVTLPRGATELERVADVAGALAADERLVCAAAYQGRIACFDQGNGSVVWSREFSGISGVEMSERYLFASDEAAVVQGYDKERGASLWKQERLRGRQLTTPLALSNYLAVADFQGYVHLLDMETGAFAARAATDGGAVRGQMLALRQGVIAQTAKGGVFAFRIQELGGGAK